MKTPRIADRYLRLSAAMGFLSLAVAFAPPSRAQDEGAPEAPRIIVTPQLSNPELRPRTPSSGTPSITQQLQIPNRARLAPLPERREEPVEEIVVVGTQYWRLPDLGSDWRAAEEAEREARRYRLSAFPLYDPTVPPVQDNLALGNRDGLPSGEIQLFLWRFGGGSSDSSDADTEP